VVVVVGARVVVVDEDELLVLVLDVVVGFPGCVGRAAEVGWATRRSVHAKTLRRTSRMVLPPSAGHHREAR